MKTQEKKNSAAKNKGSEFQKGKAPQLSEQAFYLIALDILLKGIDKQAASRKGISRKCISF